MHLQTLACTMSLPECANLKAIVTNSLDYSIILRCWHIYTESQQHNGGWGKWTTMDFKSSMLTQMVMNAVAIASKMKDFFFNCPPYGNLLLLSESLHSF